MKDDIIAIGLLVLGGLALVFVCSCCINTGNASAVQPIVDAQEDVWTVQVSLVEGPISWSHTVKNKWAAQAYVSALEDDEPYGGYWIIYLNGIEFEAKRWHREEK